MKPFGVDGYWRRAIRWALAVALQDENASMRVGAVEALGDIGGETARRLLDQALEDQDSAVRKATNEALEELLSQDL